MMLRIGLLGYSGRMGQQIADVLMATDGVMLSSAMVRDPKAAVADHHKKGPIITSAEAEPIFVHSDVVIDFTLPAATTTHLRLAATTGKPLMCGTTGLDAAIQQTAREAAQKTAIMLAPNTSLSLAVTAHLARLAATMLRGHDYDVAILDEHHRMKKDAPSGTAQYLAGQVAAGNGKAPPPITSIRTGHIVGEHEVLFAGEGEIIRIHHSVTDRRIFARGAVAAARWLVNQPCGLYGMHDMLMLGA